MTATTAARILALLALAALAYGAIPAAAFLTAAAILTQLTEESPAHRDARRRNRGDR